MFGAHISIAQGIEKAPKRASKLGCECFQIFTHSPHSGQAGRPTDWQIKKFKTELEKYQFKNFYIHAPYYINLASAKNNIYYGSISAIKKDLALGNILGAKYLMTHLGSFFSLLYSVNSAISFFAASFSCTCSTSIFKSIVSNSPI